MTSYLFLSRRSTISPPLARAPRAPQAPRDGRHRRGHWALTLLFTVLASLVSLTVATDVRAQNEDDARPRPARRAPVTESDGDEDVPSYAISVNGPGAGRTQGSIGLGLFYFRPGSTAAPALDFGIVHGIHDVVDFRFSTALAIVPGNNVSVYGTVDPYFLFRMTGQRMAMANVGLRLGPELMYQAGGGGGIVQFGVTPGLAASFGASKVQATMGLDFPIFFAVAGSVSGTGTVTAIRPAIGIEGNIAGSTNIFLKLAPTFLFEGGFYNFSAFAGVNF